jgi:hypothetical protein
MLTNTRCTDPLLEDHARLLGHPVVSPVSGELGVVSEVRQLSVVGLVQLDLVTVQPVDLVVIEKVVALGTVTVGNETMKVVSVEPLDVNRCRLVLGVPTPGVGDTVVDVQVVNGVVMNVGVLRVRPESLDAETSVSGVQRAA